MQRATPTLSLVGSLLLGCGALAPDELEPSLPDPEQVRQPIVGGEADTASTAVVALVRTTRNTLGLCTGSLIAPNLVLTARHCVAPLPSTLVTCDDDNFSEPYAPGTLFVTSAAELTSNARVFAVAQVLVPSTESNVCGSDIALVRLSSNVPSTTATPIVPRLDDPVTASEPYTAIGFGDALLEGQAGIRRSRGDLEVMCGTGECSEPQSFTDTEFVGDEGVCEGDSGGPALDDEGLILGVASRGSRDCVFTIYSAVSPWSDWLRSAAEVAAEVGAYPAPAWVGPTDTADSSVPLDPAESEPTPSDEDPSVADGRALTLEDEGCALRPHAPHQPNYGTWLFGLSLGAVALRRRARTGGA